MSTSSEWDVFLSSAFMNFMEVREKICALDTKRFWPVDPQLDPERGTPHFVIMDTLVERIRESHVFICVLRDRYGSSVFGQTESVSFLETEIYQAALFHSDAHFFLMEPFNPDNRLKGLIDLVNVIRPGLVPAKALPEHTILDEIKQVLDRTATRKHRPWSISLRRLVGELAIRRGHPKPDIEFFDNVFRSIYNEKEKRPDIDHIEFLLKSLDGDLDVEHRLTRLWVALRELSAAPYDNPTFRAYLPFWDQVLSAWTSAAAWYGLHGHLYAGRLAGVNSLLKVRAATDERKLQHVEYIHGTKGGRASEYYSMARLMPTRRQRRYYLELGLTDVNDAIHFVSDEASGYLAIRGSIYRAQGRLSLALRDFKQMLTLRQKRGDAGGVGEALADLGLTQLYRGHIREAQSLLQEATEILEGANRNEFAIRARRRLATSYMWGLHPYRAFRELCRAYDLAQERRVYSQITPLMETVHELGCKMGAWKPASH